MPVCNNFARKTLRLFFFFLSWSTPIYYSTRVHARVSAATPNRRYKRLGFSLARSVDTRSVNSPQVCTSFPTLILVLLSKTASSPHDVYIKVLNKQHFVNVELLFLTKTLRHQASSPLPSPPPPPTYMLIIGWLFAFCWQKRDITFGRDCRWLEQ